MWKNRNYYCGDPLVRLYALSKRLDDVQMKLDMCRNSVKECVKDRYIDICDKIEPYAEFILRNRKLFPKVICIHCGYKEFNYDFAVHVGNCVIIFCNGINIYSSGFNKDGIFADDFIKLSTEKFPEDLLVVFDKTGFLDKLLDIIEEAVSLKLNSLGSEVNKCETLQNCLNHLK